MTITRTDTNQTWDSDGNLIHEEVVTVDITVETNRATLMTQAVAALTQLQTYIDAAPLNVTSIATAQTAVRQLQAAVVYEARILKKLIPLVLGDLDALTDADTS